MVCFKSNRTYYTRITSNLCLRTIWPAAKIFKPARRIRRCYVLACLTFQEQYRAAKALSKRLLNCTKSESAKPFVSRNSMFCCTLLYLNSNRAFANEKKETILLNMTFHTFRVEIVNYCMLVSYSYAGNVFEQIVVVVLY